MSDKMMKVAGKTSNSTAKGMGVTNDGEVISVRRFENITPTVIVPANTEIRDTNRHATIDVECDLYAHAVNCIIVTTTLDADIDVIVLDGGRLANQGYMYKLDGSRVGFTIPKSVGNASKVYIITSEDIPELDYIKFLKLNYAAKTTPTSGSFKVEVIHKG